MARKIKNDKKNKKLRKSDQAIEKEIDKNKLKKALGVEEEKIEKKESELEEEIALSEKPVGFSDFTEFVSLPARSPALQPVDTRENLEEEISPATSQESTNRFDYSARTPSYLPTTETREERSYEVTTMPSLPIRNRHETITKTQPIQPTMASWGTMLEEGERKYTEVERETLGEEGKLPFETRREKLKKSPRVSY